MNVYTAVAIHNVAIISLVGLGIYITHEWIPLMGLFFLSTVNIKTDNKDIKEEK